MRERHDRSSNRIVFAIVMASLIIGSALIVLSGIPPERRDIPVIETDGFLTAGLIGLGLLVPIIRKGNL